MLEMTDLSALFFDMDGTLIDTASANHAAYAAAFASFGVIVEENEFKEAALGRHWRDFVPEMLAKARSTANPEDIARLKRDIYPQMLGLTRLNHGLVALARSVRKSIPVGLVTTASSSAVGALLAQHGLVDSFDTIVTGQDVSAHKPAPDAYLLASTRLGVRPENCLAFEDTDTGAQAARSAGMTVVRITMD